MGYMGCLLPVVVALLAIVGWVTTWLTNREKIGNSPRLKILLVGAILLSALLGFVGCWNKYGQARDLEKARKSRLLIQSRLEPFAELAKEEYPGLLEADRLKRLLGDMAKRPELVLLETSPWQKAEDSGLWEVLYRFDSKHAQPLRDITIQMLFDGPIIRAERVSSGSAVTLRKGCRWEQGPNGRGFTYRTGLLAVGDEIHIRVTAPKPVTLIEKNLSSR
ncbi:MAG: hypothetical protein R6X20_01755 [Phycisphaerae bacterium]